MIIGLSFLLTREMAFSLWVCYWLARLEAMLGSALGISGLTTAAGGDSFSFPGQQTAAAYLALAAASIWIARRPLAQVVTAGLTLQKHPDEDREPLSYRAAVWGGIVCLVFMTAWCSHAGMPVVTAVALWLIVFGYMLAMTRMLAEGGMPWLDHPTWGAQDVLRAVIPYRSMSVQQWTAVAAVIPYCYHLRVNPMPRIMQSLKISDESGTSNRHVTWSLLIATIIAIPVGLYALISAGYVYGGVAINPARFVSMARYSGIFMERVTNSALKHTDWISLGIMGYSATKLFTLSYLRLRYLWWPLHPVAYAMSFNVYVVREWLSVLIGWLAQATIMRYGGHRAVQRYRPFFLGLILGAMLVCGVWLIIDGITGLRDHKILY